MPEEESYFIYILYRCVYQLSEAHLLTKFSVIKLNEKKKKKRLHVKNCYNCTRNSCSQLNMFWKVVEKRERTNSAFES